MSKVNFTHEDFAEMLYQTVFHSQYSVSQVLDEMPEEEIQRLRTMIFLSIYGYLMHTDAVSNMGEDSQHELRQLCDAIDVTDLESEVNYQKLFLDILYKFENDGTGKSYYAYSPNHIPYLT